MSKETFDILQTDDLKEIAPLLSEESYQNLKTELKRLKCFPPQATGLGVECLNYIPRTFEECKIKIKNQQIFDSSPY